MDPLFYCFLQLHTWQVKYLGKHLQNEHYLNISLVANISEIIVKLFLKIFFVLYIL